MAYFDAQYYSFALDRIVSFAVILPMEDIASRNYPDKSFKTMYLLHGIEANRRIWPLKFNLEELAEEYGIAFVMPDGGNSFYTDHQDTNYQYGKFVGEELVEATRRMFPLSVKRDDTILCGYSMGGYGALVNGLKYCSTFGAIIAMSSALITDSLSGITEGNTEMNGHVIGSYGFYRHCFGDLSMLRGSDLDPRKLAMDCLQADNAPRLMLACGMDDFLWGVNEDFHDYLQSIGYGHVWYSKEGYAHKYPFWNLALNKAFRGFVQGSPLTV